MVNQTLHKKYYFVSLFILFCFSTLSFAQNLKPDEIEQLLEKRNYYSDLQQLDSVINIGLILLKTLENQDSLRIDLLYSLSNDTGNAYYFMGDNKSAIRFYEKCLYYLKLGGYSSLALGATKMNIGLIHFSEGDYLEAEKNYLEGITILEPESDDPNRISYLTRIVVALSAAKGEQKKYEEERIYLQRAYSLIVNEPEEWEAKVDVYLNLAFNAGDRKAYEEEREFALRAERIMKQYLPDNYFDYPRLYTLLANTYFHVEAYDTAINYHKKTIEFYQKYLPPLHTELTIPYENIGNCFIRLKNFEKAKSYLNKALEVHQYNDYSQSPRTAYTYQLLTLCYFEEGSLQQALRQTQLAFQQLRYNEQVPLDFSKVNSLYILMDVLHLKSNILYALYDKTKKKEDLLLTEKCSDIELSLMDSIDLIQIEEEEQVAFKENYYNVYEKALMIQHEYLNRFKSKDALIKSLFIVERSKNSLLKNSLSRQSILQKGGPQAAALTEEKALKNQYSALVIKSSEKTLSDSSRLVLEQEMFSVKQKIWRLRKKNVPFSLNKIDISVNRIRERIKGLSKQEAYLHFFLNHNSLFVWLIKNDEVVLEKIEVDDSFYQSIIKYREHIYNASAISCDSVNYYGHSIYTQLFTNTIQEKLTGIQSVKIIPAGIIHLIPFEALNSKPQQKGCKHSNYLIHTYEIAYQFSLLPIKSDPVNFNKQLFAGFAPSYHNNIQLEDTSSNADIAFLVRNGTYHLPGAIDEVKSIGQILNGDIFLDTFASKQVFLSNTAQYQMLHLAMHSFVNDENPMLSYLLFEKKKGDKPRSNELYALELYNMQLNAELVVLSSCNSGFGKVRQGEGVLSLAQAFAHAGVKSTLMSLWKVPDNATSKIMVNFYEELNSSLNKSQALRSAKLNWINDEAIPSQLKHPYYWAGFIIAGDANKVDTAFKLNLFHIIIAFLVLFGAIFIFFKKK